MIAETPRWMCQVCRLPLDPATNDGAIWVDYAEWRAYEEAEAKWQVDHGNELIASTALELDAMPRFDWHVAHDACDAQDRTALYWIDVDRLDTWAKVAEWSAHLHDNVWFAETNWGGLLYGAGVGAVPA